MEGQSCFAFFIVFTALFGFGNSSAPANVRVDISPAQVVEGDGTPVEIACSSEMLAKVLMISFTFNNNSPLAFVRDGSRVTSTEIMSGRIHTEGRVSNNAKESFLKLQILSPTSSDTGVYTCIFYYLNDNGNMVKDTASSNLTVEAPPPVTTQSPVVTTRYSAENILANLLDRLVQINLNGELQPYWIIGLTEAERRGVFKDINENKTQVVFDKESLKLKAVLDRLTKLESIVYTSTIWTNETKATPGVDENLTERVNNLEKENKNISQQIESLSDRVTATQPANVLKRVQALENQSSTQSQELAALHAKDASATFFHSTFNQVNLQLKKGMVLSFPDILTQQGPGFDPKTGIFTAPRDGIYAFHLTIDNSGTGRSLIALKSDGRYFSRLETGHSGDKGQTSVSSVIHLKAGQEVKAIVVDAIDKALLRGYSYSAFTGYLIWS